MATYAYLNILLEERTAFATAPNGVSTQITIPTIVVSGKTIRPRGFAFADATGDFAFKTGLPLDLGDSYDVVAANLAANAQIVRALGATDQLWLEGAAADERVTIRWFWAHDARDGLDLAAPHGVLIPTQSFSESAPANETVITPPDGAVELVIESIDANAIQYRIDDGDDVGVAAEAPLTPGGTAGFTATMKAVGSAGNAWTFDIPAATGNPVAKSEVPTSIALTDWDAATTTIQDVLDLFNNDPASLVTLRWDGVGATTDLLDNLVTAMGGAPVSEPFAGGADPVVVINTGEVSVVNPYRIYLHEDDQLRWNRVGGAAIVQGYWRYTG